VAEPPVLGLEDTKIGRSSSATILKFFNRVSHYPDDFPFLSLRRIKRFENRIGAVRRQKNLFTLFIKEAL